MVRMVAELNVVLRMRKFQEIELKSSASIYGEYFDSIQGENCMVE